MNNQKRGISLIVLVITIVVMLILATVVIISLNNNQIINSANKAVEDNNLSEIKNMAALSWASAYTSNIKTNPELETYVFSELQNNGVDTDKYIITVTEKGVNVESGWKTDYETLKVTNTITNAVINIGDYIKYNDQAGSIDGNGNRANVYAGDWQVLGSNENGELLIMSSVGAKDVELSGDNGYIFGIQTLNNACSEYASGYGAKAARSVTSEDIYKLLNYNIEVAGVNNNYVYSYGNTATYSWQGDNNDLPIYTSQNGSNGTMGVHQNGFTYFDGQRFVVSSVSATQKTITTITNSSAATPFSISILDPRISENNMYRMIYNDVADNYYWLATKKVYLGNSSVFYSIGTMTSGIVGDYVISGSIIVSSSGTRNTLTRKIRPVVAIDKNIQLEVDTLQSNTWDLK